MITAKEALEFVNQAERNRKLLMRAIKARDAMVEIQVILKCSRTYTAAVRAVRELKEKSR